MKNYTQDDILTIKELHRKTKDTVMQRKYLSIRLHMEGYTNKHIASIVDLDEHTVGIYIKTYDAQGVNGLVPKKQPGRPKRLSDDQEKNLYETISTMTPEEVGFDGIKNWTAKIACHWVKREYGIEYTVNGMLDLFHRLNLSYTRPTYVLAKADPEKQEQFRKNFDEVKKTPKR